MLTPCRRLSDIGTYSSLASSCQQACSPTTGACALDAGTCISLPEQNISIKRGIVRNQQISTSIFSRSLPISHLHRSPIARRLVSIIIIIQRVYNIKRHANLNILQAILPSQHTLHLSRTPLAILNDFTSLMHFYNFIISCF